jgi:ankyrin repeat protein
LGKSLDEIRKLLSGLEEEKKKEFINAPDPFGNTPLHVASLHKRIMIVRYLVAQGAEVNAKNEAGSSPLHCAVVSGSSMIVNFFLEQENITWTTNESGNSPLYYSRGDEQIFSILLNREPVKIKDSVEVPY